MQYRPDTGLAVSIFFHRIKWDLVNKKEYCLRLKKRGRLFTSPSGSEDVTASFGPLLFYGLSGTVVV